MFPWLWLTTEVFLLCWGWDGTQPLPSRQGWREGNDEAKITPITTLGLSVIILQGETRSLGINVVFQSCPFLHAAAFLWQI